MVDTTPQDLAGGHDAPQPGLRLQVDPDPRRIGALAGAWWPRSRVLSAELPALIEGLNAWLNEFGPGHGEQITRVAVHLSQWTSVPRHLDVGGRRVALSSFGAVDANTVSAACGNGYTLDLLVVPPQVATDAAGAAMAMAMDRAHRERASAILAAVLPERSFTVEPARSWDVPAASASAAWNTTT